MAKLRAWCERAHLCVRCYLRIAYPAGSARYGGRDGALRTHHAYGYSAVDGCSCAGCLGVLSDTVLDSVPYAALEVIESKKILHDGRYKLIAAFPASAAHVRERSLWVALKSDFPTQGLRRPHSLREAFKQALSDRLTDVGLKYDADAPLFIDVLFRHDAVDAECAFLADEDTRIRKAKGQKPGKRPRTKHGNGNRYASTNQIVRVLKEIDDQGFRNIAPEGSIPPPIPEYPVASRVSVSVENLLLAGEYNKYSRVVSQTPWLVGKTRDPKQYANGNGTKEEEDKKDKKEASSIPPPPDYASSVEDVVTAGMKEVFRADSITFTAGGREDVDVRCLGKGRPFVIELANPRIVESLVTDEMLQKLSAVAVSTSTAVGVRNLRVAPKDHFSQMKVCEGEKRKRYRCVIWTEQPVEEGVLREKLERIEKDDNKKEFVGFLLAQKTPLRVLHRRTLLVRERRIYEAKIPRIINQHFFILDLVAQAGTYIKEFVHGDNGRTKPNVGALLNSKAEILQLDVLEVGDKVGDKK